MENKIETSIFEVMKKEAGKPIPAGILMEKVKSNLELDDRKLIYKIIDKLIENKKLKKLESGKIIEGYLNGPLLDIYYEGIIILNSSLDGYVKILDDNKQLISEYYINFLNLNGALNGDKVKIQLMDKNSKNGIQNAIVKDVIEHNTQFAVGTFLLVGSEYEIKLDDKKNYLKIKLDSIDKLVNGHKILIKFLEFNNNIIYSGVSQILGHIDDIGMDIVSIVAGNNINQDFSADALKFTNNCTIDINENKGVRIDISDRLIITIDPATSKDLDDAIHIRKLDNGNYFLSVSIADVSHYVKWKSILDKEALDRATSVYLVDRVIPMLPHYLSNNICSLNPNEKRLCMTCDLEIDSNGNYSNIKVYPSIIESKKRFSYDEVNEFYNGSQKDDWSDELKNMLLASRELHTILRKKKYKDGYIDFDVKEPLIIVDEKCWPIDIKIKKRGIAQMMIEDCMICANEAVTINAEKLGIPFIYRIHEKPQINKLKLFSIEVKKLSFRINEDDFNNIQPKTLTNWLENNKDNPNSSLINKLLLRCMSKAIYSTDNIGHFGLSSKNYTHFTSPIRRAPDMIVHRLYWMYCFEADKYTDNDREELKNQLSKLCEHCTDKEINAVSTEREVNQLKFCQYCSNHVGEIYDGTITTITSFGIFIELENTIEGLVRIRNIGKDFWNFNVETNTIIGNRTGNRFTFGQKVKIRIQSVDISAKQINFEIVGFEQEVKNNNFKQPRRENNRSFKKY